MKLAYHVMSSPVGLLFLAGTPRGLRHLEFMDRKSLKRMIGAHDGEIADAVWEPSLLGLTLYVDQLDEYFCEDRKRFTLPLDPAGTPFQMQVWSALCAIPYGETRSYGDLARAISQPRASRAIGLANHENPIAIVIPCHRVIGAGGALVGYGGGLPRKRWLLEHERRFAEPAGQGDLFARAAGRRSRPAAGAGAPARSPAGVAVARAASVAAAPAARGTAAARSARRASGRETARTARSTPRGAAA